jgi:DNA polymerase I-like protein with 3'-5' exonuclease and polymerase domains
MHDLLEVLKPQLNPETSEAVYKFERASLGPALAMMKRGCRIDLERRRVLIAEFTEEYDQLVGLSKALAGSVMDGSEDFNPASPDQVSHILYTCLSIPPIYSHKAKSRKTSTGEDALDYIINNYPVAAPFCRCILAIREVGKKLDVLNAGLDEDGRIRCSYNVAGTVTYRWSSSKNVHDGGGNLQNINKAMRRGFVPDPGYTMFEADLEQAESRGVAYMAEDEDYIAACEGGDLHTDVACGVFNIPPSKVNELIIGDKSYRFMAKVSGHGTNYLLTEQSLAKHNKITLAQATKFQALYKGMRVPLKRAVTWGWFDETGGVIDRDFEGRFELVRSLVDDTILDVDIKGKFKGIRKWQESTREQVQATGKLRNPIRMERQFWGRLTEDRVIREAVASGPQSLIGGLLNIGLWRVWSELELATHPACEKGDLQLLLQVHDSVVGQIKTEKLDKILPLVVECLENPVEIHGRIMLIPAAVKVGMNWQPQVEKDGVVVDNFEGLKSWKNKKE